MARKSLNKKSLKRAFPKAQNGLGRFIPPSQSLGRVYNSSDPRADFLPTQSYQMGNPLFAIGNTARFVQGLASGKDRDGDGLMDGAFRDGQAKRRRNKRAKMANRTYRDQYGRVLQGDPEELWKKSKDPSYEMRTPQEKQQDLLKYSRVTHDGKGNPMIFNADREFDKRDYTKKNRLKSKLPFGIGDKFPTAEEMYDSGLALDDPKTQQLLQSMYPSQTGVFQSPASDRFKPTSSSTTSNPTSNPTSGTSSGTSKDPMIGETQSEYLLRTTGNPGFYNNTDVWDGTKFVDPSQLNSNKTNDPGFTAPLPGQDDQNNITPPPVVPTPTPDPLSPADEFFSPYATKNFSPVTYKLADGSTQTYKTADDLYKGIIDPNMSYVDAERLFEAGYGRMDNGQFTQLTNYTTPGTGQYGAADNYLTSTDQVTNYATNSPATYSQYGPAKNVPKHGIETDLPGFTNASKPVQDMLRMVHFNTGIDPRVFVADASGQFKGNRGDYSVRGTGDISTIYNEDMLKNVDPQKLLESINDIYRSLVKNTGSLAEQNPSYAKRVQFLADRYNLNVPENTYTPARQRGGSLPKAQGGKSTAEMIGLTTYPYDLPNLPAGRSIAEFTGNFDDVYNEAMKDRSLYNGIIMYNGKPILLKDASETRSWSPTADDPLYYPYRPGETREQTAARMKAEQEKGDEFGLDFYQKLAQAKINNDEDEYFRLANSVEEHERYKRSVASALEKARLSEATAQSELDLINQNNRIDFEKVQEENAELAKNRFEVAKGQSSTYVAPPLAVQRFNDDQKLEYFKPENLPQHSESFNYITDSEGDQVSVKEGQYLTYDKENDELKTVYPFQVKGNPKAFSDDWYKRNDTKQYDEHFLLPASEVNNVNTMSEQVYTAMKENLSEEDFNKWYKTYQKEGAKNAYNTALTTLKESQSDKEAYLQDKANKDAQWENYQNMSELSKINANVGYVIRHPFQSIVAGLTDPVINAFTDQNIGAKDYIKDEIYGTNTVEESSPWRSSNQYGLGKNNILDMFSPVESVYEGTKSLGNIATGDGSVQDVLNIGMAAMDVLPVTKLKYLTDFDPKLVKQAFKSDLDAIKNFKLKPSHLTIPAGTAALSLGPTITAGSSSPLPYTEPSIPIEALDMNFDNPVSKEDKPDSRTIKASFQKGGLPKAQVGTIISKGIKYLDDALGGVSKLTRKSPEFVSDVNWSKFNSDIPLNKTLMDEYKNIEQMTKADNSWLKNIDNTDFVGTNPTQKDLDFLNIKMSPEEAIAAQFIQSKSSGFKNSFPDGFENVYRGMDIDNPLLIDPKNQGTYTGLFTGDKSTAGAFGNNMYHLAQKPSPNSIKFNALGDDWSELSFAQRGLPGSPESIKGFEWQLTKQKDFLNSLIKRNAPIDLINSSKARVSELERLYDTQKVNTPEFENMFNYFYDTKVSTDDLAKYMEKSNLNRISIDNVGDGISKGNISINNQIPGNYLKSLLGNDGSFNLFNPNSLKKYGGIPKAQAGMNFYDHDYAGPNSSINQYPDGSISATGYTLPPMLTELGKAEYFNAQLNTARAGNQFDPFGTGARMTDAEKKAEGFDPGYGLTNAPGGPGGPGGAGSNTGTGGTNTGIDLQSMEIGPEAYDQDLFNTPNQSTMPPLVDDNLPVDLLDPNRPGDSFNTNDDPGFDYTQTNKQLRNRFNNKFKNPFKRKQDNISNTGVDDDIFIENDLTEREQISPFGPGDPLENTPDPTQNDLLKNIDWDNVTYTTSDPNLEVSKDKRSIGQLRNDFLNSRFAEKMGALGNAAQAASSVNDFIDEYITKPGVENAQQWNQMADARAGAYQVNPEQTKGVYDVNTGLKRKNIFGDGPSGFDSYGAENYMVKMGGQLFETGTSNEDMIQDLDTETIAKLIAAGADIEIL